MKIVLIVQGRLGSSRLFQKALLPFGDKTLLHYVLSNLKNIDADEYCLATDKSSFDAFLPIATECNFNIVKGSENDVLERYCLAAKTHDASVIIRATADNPFLFCDAANFSVKRFLELKKSNIPCDYFTLSNMPHGSGVEVFDAKKLYEAAANTTSLYDHEHVGPAFYNHQDKYACVFENAPQEWNCPNYRITVDTYSDYKKALRIQFFLRQKTGLQKGFSSKDIIALKNEQSIESPILFIPSVKKGHGTGHLRRCFDLAQKLDSYIFLDDSKDKVENLISLVSEVQIQNDKIIDSKKELNRFLENVSEKPFSLVVIDNFISDNKFIEWASLFGSVLAIDEGNCNRLATNKIDYLLDIIPSKKLKRTCNLKDSSFIALPKNKKTLDQKNLANESLPKSALVCIGGEDPANFSKLAERALKSQNIDVTVVSSNNPVANLKEELYKYDLVVTHYGFTAFEAAAAGCAVLTVATTSLHKYLSKSEGFVCATKSALKRPHQAKKLVNVALRARDVVRSSGTPLQENAALRESAVPLSAGDSAMHTNATPLPENAESCELATFIKEIALSKKISCPVCGTNKAAPKLDNRLVSDNCTKTEVSPKLDNRLVSDNCTKTETAPKQRQDIAIFRNAHRTIKECSLCKTKFLALETEKTSQYQENYFFEDYKKQYGKTYLEDFESIKSQGKRRLAIIQKVSKIATPRDTRINCNTQKTPQSVLDIGCAYGPFLSAAKDCGFNTFGTDISEAATNYVSQKLCIPTFTGDFTKINFEKKFSVVTMWYVIEHFENLATVLAKVNNLLDKKGIFAFSTPCGQGISAKKRTKSFYSNSPIDHFSIWTFKSAKKVLKMYGFKICKIVSTGHHPERFFKNGLSQNTHPHLWKIVLRISRIFKLGDTFEVYAIKTDKKRHDVASMEK